ncbi:uncharacterized protein UV8b_08040 [Ustilaginoidea virens]|uniref:Chromatin modification-related protein n=1 Tax=Ustilaginoidea virens TaxID=1159556 RepID=A0A8E5HY82_USTVR|nr:uncharacterized protein UV8b_08040 [Ustilaginoidea virens]QUC23799.1 hypothetical protein UV8b_08040 [Ustilaginoidea virens]
MKSAKSVAVDTPPSLRRSQPVRQARTNTPRSSANAGRRAGHGRDAVNGRPLGNQPIEIFPAVTHFADTMAALPKELVRHFTLLKEVDAKIFAPEEQLFNLVAATAHSSLPEPRVNNDSSSSATPASAPMSAQTSCSDLAKYHQAPPSSSTPSLHHVHSTSVAPTRVFDPSNIPRRQLFRQTAFKIQEMLVSLEEKNHVLSTANEALQRQLQRAEDVWPYLENEFSDEAKWGSTTHWAYPENRLGGKVSHTEKVRRDGAAAISAAAQALADEAAARSDARKQAVQAKKNLKNQHQDSDADDLDGRQKEGPTTKKTGKSRKSAAGADANFVGLGISGSSTNGNPPHKRRKVEKTANGTAAPTSAGAGSGAGGGATTAATASAVLGAGAMSAAFANNTPNPKTGSPRGTPAPEAQKKRKALPTGSGQAKKKNGLSPSTTSSPVMAVSLDPKVPARASPAPSSAPRPASSRARQNSIQSNADNARVRAPSATAAAATTPAPTPATAPAPPAAPASSASKTNGNVQNTPEEASTAASPGTNQDKKPFKENSMPVKPEPVKMEHERLAPTTAPTESTTASTPIATKRDSKPEHADRGKSESTPTPPLAAPPTVTTKSGRACKPSTPALATFQEAAGSRSRPSRTMTEGAARKSHKKTGSVAAQALIQQVQAADTDASSSMQDDDEGDIDADEPTYCYCNSVSYGEMVACDADGCEREWFHLACVGLKVAPGSKTKWFCEDCKERLKMGGKKTGR